VAVAPPAAEVGATAAAALTGSGLYSGISLASGDFDGDGHPDLVAGSYTAGLNAPVVDTFPGSATGIDPAVSYQESEGTPGSYWGGQVASPGDINADGYDDLVVAATIGSYITIHLGGPGGWSAPGVEIDGPVGSYFGQAFATGDFGGDGYDDVVVGSPAQYTLGAAYLFEGGPAGFDTDSNATLVGDSVGDGFGSILGSLGDVNGDGYDDLATSSAGSVRIYQGGPPGAFALPVITLADPVAGGAFGQVVAGAGDIDGDGFDDLLVSDPSEDTSAVDAGAVYVYRGSAAGISANPSFTLLGVAAGDAFGQGANGIGDTNADGYGDIAIGAYLAEGDNGETSIFMGSAAGPVEPGFVLSGPAFLGYFGHTLLGADFDDDGLSDLAVSAYAVGHMYVYRGIIDADHDGFDTTTDCDDANAAVHPGAIEVCNGTDDDCAGVADEGAVDAATWYADADADGYGALASGLQACAQPVGTVADATDCDDADAAINPGAAEICNGLDDDCDGDTDVDATDAILWYSDADGDGFGTPDATTLACDQPDNYVADDTDCDAADSNVNPDAEEVCNGIDDDCDTAIDVDATDAGTWYPDADGDGYGDSTQASIACDQPAGSLSNGGDCDDAAADVHPTAPETCDGIDDDCDAEVDEDATDAGTFYADSDGDGFGDPGSATKACDAADGIVGDATDCDDANPDAFPGGTEIAGDGIDQDCDGSDAGGDAGDSDGCGCATGEGTPPVGALLAIGLVVAARRRRSG
jgi:MYXO-CTERM domain-containing protein